jgi:aminopeptidase N
MPERSRTAAGSPSSTARGGPTGPARSGARAEDDNNHDWFPTYDFPNDRMTWEMVATVPASFTAVSNGRLVKRCSNRAGPDHDLRQDKPASTYLVSLIVAPLVKIHDTWGTVPVDLLRLPRDSARAWPLFHVTPDMIAVYSRLTGVRYPWPKYAQTTVADFFGGMENVSATTAGRLAAGPRRLTSTGPGTSTSSFPTSWPTNGSGTWSPPRTGPTCGSMKGSPSSCRGSTGR